MEKLQELSLVSKVCTELENHLGMSDKTLAEFIIEMVRAGRGQSGALTAHLLLLLAAWIVGIFNSFIHARDGWTAVVPTGISLSIGGAVLSLLAGSFWQSASRPQAGDLR